MLRSQKTDELYREALHTLLLNNPSGLSDEDIKASLTISQSKCDELLKSEQIREAINANPDTGTLIYTTNAKIKPSRKLEDILEVIQENLEENKKKKGYIIKAFLVLLAFILLSLLKQVIWYSPAPASEVNLLIREQQDLETRIEKMKFDESKCYELWNKSETCYITNRLLNEKEFKGEIAEMMSRINQISQSIGKSIGN